MPEAPVFGLRQLVMGKGGGRMSFAQCGGLKYSRVDE